ncbi:MAG: hypothetical protein OXH86_15320 [Acidimicrobiaceae bacterium]|uniref:hypothetical protein n=1 Tax=Candidatus Poriferisodalis multihospitum TaxID=2983191 RepID=UPI00238215B2|nr:hypothetical protein [Candidatus Poriferisodalis multihospitum]MDE0135773.1 hypothetical protein [Acidimicrobiaceae bacterium]MDE0498717.1 hypothetical protein [Acidimicrobiaceae bacterium]
MKLRLSGEICTSELGNEFVLGQSGLCENASHGLAQAVEGSNASTAILGDNRNKEPDRLAVLLDDKRIAGRDQLSGAVPEFPNSY